MSLTMAQAFTHRRGGGSLRQRPGSQSNCQLILCISLDFATFVICSLVQSNLHGDYVYFLSIFGIISQCCNMMGLFHFLYPASSGKRSPLRAAGNSSNRLLLLSLFWDFSVSLLLSYFLNLLRFFDTQGNLVESLVSERRGILVVNSRSLRRTQSRGNQFRLLLIVTPSTPALLSLLPKRRSPSRIWYVH